MSRVGWLQDDHGYVGGAEMTAAEFRAAAPKDVELVDCLPGQVDHDCDTYVVHNAVQYHRDELDGLRGKRVVKYAHDLFRYSPWGTREWLQDHAEWIFCSHAQRERMGIEGECIPPALDLNRITPSRQVKRNTERKGTVSIAQWRNPGKGMQQLAEWAAANGPVDVFGPGEFIPQGRGVNYLGDLEQARVPDVLASYETFVFLPVEFEPFCRTAVEAYYAGCALVVNDLIGARHYIEENPEALESAAEDFWKVVCPAT